MRCALDVSVYYEQVLDHSEWYSHPINAMANRGLAMVTTEVGNWREGVVGCTGGLLLGVYDHTPNCIQCTLYPAQLKLTPNLTHIYSWSLQSIVTSFQDHNNSESCCSTMITCMKASSACWGMEQMR